MTKREQKPPVHPKAEIRQLITRANLSVTEAAKRLGVGRPALSNLLNGKAALSPKMAMRFEKAFDVSSKRLLAEQARYNENKVRGGQENQIVVRPYVPTYLQITADQIATWSDVFAAREQFAALLRILVHSTGSDLTKVDFPAFSNAQRAGWDGQVDSGSPTPWIPLGKSRWEFSCSRTVKPKADADYDKRTIQATAAEREVTSFVFVTSRNWPGKEQWEKSKRSKSLWKDVRAFDASDLEQWLEQSIPAQARFREFQGSAVIEQVVSLDQIWSEWARVAEPNLHHDLFSPTVERYRDTLEKWFLCPPADPLIVAADSSLEALAFLACAIDRLRQVAPSIYDRTIIIRSRDAFNKILNNFRNFVAIIASSEVEQGLAGFYQKTHTIIVRERSALIKDPDIMLDPIVGHKDFQKALNQMGFDDHQIDCLARESGRSPTVLRRRLSKIPAIQCPPWMKDNDIVRTLIPLIFVGAWDSSVAGDNQVLCCLANKENSKIQEVVLQLQKECDPPVWVIGNCCGIVSKIDALYATSNSITYADLINFLSISKEVLSELDPALELPENERWAAVAYNKSRKYSSMLRQGICDTLVLMSVHGNALFRKRLGIDIAGEVSQIVNHLLAPPSKSTWLSQRKDLPQYAEAAPNTFLRIVENDINRESPEISTLFVPVENNIFGGCLRAELLWALELLAWNPQWLTRVIIILAQLCQWRIDDNWGNNPWGTLASIFRFWMPQTAASLDERNRAFAVLTEKYPDVGWKVCVGQFHPNSIVVVNNCRPRWRADAHEAGQIVMVREERQKAKKHAIELALNWPSYDSHQLGDLIECLGFLCHKNCNLVWDRIVAWSSTEPSDMQKSILRERIRICTLTRRSQSHNPNLSDALQDRARDVYALLEPSDPVARHRWLFLGQWIEASADEIDNTEIDHHKRAKQIGRQRREALIEIWQKLELTGILNLCKISEASGQIGFHLAEIHTTTKSAVDFVEGVLSVESVDLHNKLDQCIREFLANLDSQKRSDTLSQLLTRLTGQHRSCVRLLRCSPFDSNTWRYVDKFPESFKEQYWKEVNPQDWGHQDTFSAARFVDEFLKVNRPHAAFFAIQLRWNLIDSKRLVRILTQATTNNVELPNHYPLNSYYLSEAFDVLEERGDISRDELAELEFMFIKVLGHTTHGIRNLEAQIAKAPALFIQALAVVFKRNDGGEDPAEWGLSNSDRRAHVGPAAFSLLTDAKRIPGTQTDGKINLEELKNWLEEARKLTRQYGRVVIGDQMIGQLLSHCPIGEDGVWPCEPVRDAIEHIASTDIGKGMNIGVRNSRGAEFRGEGGEQERQLAIQYRRWSKKITIEYPYTSNLLKQIACSYDEEMEYWDKFTGIRERTEI